MIIRTPDDWWLALDTHWANILEIYQNCNAPLEGKFWRETAYGDEINHDKSLLATLEDAKRDRDHEIVHKYLNLLWAAAPDKPYIHEWPSWDVLCDLCSEVWVFNPEEAA